MNKEFTDLLNKCGSKDEQEAKLAQERFARLLSGTDDNSDATVPKQKNRRP